MNYWKKQRYLRLWQEYGTVANGLVCIQLIVFLLMTFTGGSTDIDNLIRFGAKFNPYIQEGEYWRFVAPIFIHIGFEHVAINSVMLFVTGNQIEEMIGRWRFLVIYLLAGVMGNLASFAFSYAVSAGASTALFGLFGTFVYLARKHSYIQSFYQMGSIYIVLLVINIVMGFVNSGVDHFGHIGGLIGGYLIASVVSFRADRITTKQERFIALLAYIVLSIVLFVLGMSGMTAIF